MGGYAIVVNHLCLIDVVLDGVNGERAVEDMTGRQAQKRESNEVREQ